MADYITEMAQQLLDMRRRIDAIESDRVARMAELERKLVELQSGPHCAKAADVILLRKHHEALEQLVLRLDRESHADGFDKRIRELEGQENALDAAALLELRDRDRQDRWHATRDAVLSVYIEGGADHDAHIHAAEIADRAHGPLEAKAPVYPDGMPIEQDTLPARPPFHVAQERANAHTAFAPNVEALVKAARAACDLALPDSVGYDLTLALEPFETERSE